MRFLQNVSEDAYHGSARGFRGLAEDVSRGRTRANDCGIRLAVGLIDCGVFEKIRVVTTRERCVFGSVEVALFPTALPASRALTYVNVETRA